MAEPGLFDGEVVKLDRGFPLVRLVDGHQVRCEHATALVKEKSGRAVIGDKVEVSLPEGHDKGVIEFIEPRATEFVRKDPTERVLPQILAANFDRVIVAQPLAEVNFRRLERELVLAHETGAEVSVVLTKTDLADDAEVTAVADQVKALAGPNVALYRVSEADPSSVEDLRAVLARKPEGAAASTAEPTAVLIGRSGVGKSSLVNLLAGTEVQETGEVRETDGKGRHTTVSREIVALPGGGRVIDMPGVRGLGLWDAKEGIEAAFPDVVELAALCRFRDCKHEQEPGCAVREAVEDGRLSRQRFESYQALQRETEEVEERRELARRARGEQASSTSKGTSQTKRRMKHGAHGKRR